jgi:carbon-monoxide dehydrogenase medium subunit
MTRITQYIRAQTVEEAVELRRQPAAFYLAGGTDALVVPTADATTAIDIMHIDLHGVSRVNGFIDIGATTRLRDIERHPEIRDVAAGALLEALYETGPWLIRNAATLTGNICNASPSADSVPMLLALDATLRLDDRSEVALADIFTGPHMTSLGERLVTSIRLDPRGRAGVFHKLSRSKSDIAQVNLAITANTIGGVLSDVRLAMGSAAPTPLRLRRTESLIEGRAVDADLIRTVTESVRNEISPRDDWRATADFRRHSAGVMVARGLTRLADTLGLAA